MAGTGWTDAEKVGLLFQIIEEKGGGIPWDTLKLPPGRTKKACQVMIDKEKQKVKKAKEAEAGGGDGGDGDADGGETPKSTPVKRKTNGEAGGSAKKPRTPHKKKTKAGEDDSEKVDDDETAPVKDEPLEEDD